MKQLASFLMIVLLMFSVTWLQASVPDTKENSKIELTKIVKSAKMENVSVVLIVKDYSLKFMNTFENQNYFYVFNSTTFSENYKNKLSKPQFYSQINYRKARDNI